MARYIKVRPEVARYLNLQNDRLMLKDGNYILWQADMLAFGPLPRLAETLEAIGGIALMPHEAREEQDGIKLRPLPEATDPRFATPAPTPAPEEPETPAEPEVPETPVEEEEPTGGETPGENEPPAEEESAEDTDPEPEPVPEDETTAATTEPEPTTAKTKKANV